MAATVYIRKEAFLIMLWAAVETFKKECLGALLGYTPSPSRDYFLITDVIPLQKVRKRLNTKVIFGDRNYARWKEFWNQLSLRPKPIGSFHSHPEWGSNVPEVEMSEVDIKALQEVALPVQIIIVISSRKRNRFPWELLLDGSARGSFSKFNFHISAYTLVNEGEVTEPRRLQIVSPLALRKLNRAQRRKS